MPLMVDLAIELSLRSKIILSDDYPPKKTLQGQSPIAFSNKPNLNFIFSYLGITTESIA